MLLASLKAPDVLNDPRMWQVSYQATEHLDGSRRIDASNSISCKSKKYRPANSSQSHDPLMILAVICNLSLLVSACYALMSR